MALILRQSTAVTEKIGPYIDDTDGKTPETALSIAQADIRLSKNFSAFAQKNSTAVVTHAEYGWYDCPFDATDTGTLGPMKVASLKTGALPVWHDYMVLPANAYDAIVSGTDYLQTDLAQWLGVAPLALSSQLVPSIESTLESRLSALRAGYLDNLSAGAAALEATLTAIKGAGWSTETLVLITAYVDELETRLSAARAGYLDELAAANIPADVDTLLSRLSALRAGYLDNLSAGAVALEATLTAMKGAGWSTETLKAIKDAVDAITLTAAAIAAAVWDELKSGHTTAGTFGKYLDTEVSGVGGGTAAAIALAVWTYVRRTLTARETKL